MTGMFRSGGGSTESNDERDSVTVVEASPHRLSEAENQVIDSDGGKRESMTITEAAPNRLSEGAQAILNGDSDTDGYGPKSKNGPDVTIPDSATMVEPPASVPEPDPTEGNGDYTSDQNITIETTTDDGEDEFTKATNSRVDETKDAAEDAAKTVVKKVKNTTEKIVQMQMPDLPTPGGDDDTAMTAVAVAGAVGLVGIALTRRT